MRAVEADSAKPMPTPEAPQETRRCWAEETLQGMLRAVGLPVKGSYGTEEVSNLLGIGLDTAWKLLRRYELDPETGEPKRPDSIGSFRMRAKRFVPYGELVAFLDRNRSSAGRYLYRPVPPRKGAHPTESPPGAEGQPTAPGPLRTNTTERKQQ